MTPRSHRPPVYWLLLGLAACSSSTSGGGNGGSSATGGANQSGGQVGSGGASSNGGVTGTGGRSSQSGGAPGSGGNAAGGSVATGGTKASTGTGGNAAGGSTGGASSSTGGGGGTATGGSTGGGTTPASTGGRAGGTTGTGTTATTGGTTGTGGACPALPTAAVASKDIIEFNDNGGWCWYQDERAVVDAKGGKFVIGSVASGGSRDSDQEVVIYDVASASKKKYTLESDLNVDDHNAPAFVVNPDGTYAAIWATHRDTCYSYYSTFNGTAWAAYKKYDWSADGCPWDAASNPSPAHKVTYANPWYLSAEDKILSPTRSVSTSPASLQSTDGGSTWKFYGRLTSTKTVGYVAGYYKYWGNGVDRIDFVGTEAHPRDADNSLYHGYYKGGKLYDSNDKAVDDNAGDTNAQDITAFTKVFATGSSVGGTKICRMWNHDIVRYDDGTIAILGQGRADNCTSTPSGSDPDKRMIYLRWDGKTWKSTYLVKTGPKLYADEEDYTGLSAVHPDNPNVIFVSTAIDPRDDKTVLSKREIFMGVTCDNGATFKWAPITEKSTMDNIRPVVPKWDASHTLLLWMNGTYRKAQDYTMKIVGTTVLLPPTAH
jgi:hypothetical protein